MSYTRRLWITFWPAALAVAALSAVAIFRSDHDESPWVNAALVLVAGLSFVAAGLVAWSRRPDNAVGRLMVAVGFSLFLLALADANDAWTFSIGLVFGSFFLAVFIHLLLAYPSGRLPAATDRVIVAAAYPVAVLANLTLAFVTATPNDDCKGCPPNRLLVADSDAAATALTVLWDLAGAAFAVVVVAVLYRRWRAATHAARRALSPVFVSGGAAMVLLGVSFALQPIAEGAGGAVALLSLLAFVSVPYFFLAGLARLRLARADVGRLFVDVPESPSSGQVHEAFARALRDPTVRLAHWLPERELFVDLDGCPLERREDDARTWTYVEYEGRRVGAIIHDPSLVEQPELLEAAVAAARIGLEKDRLSAELRARLVELERERDFVRAVVQTSPALFLVLTPAGRVVRFNAALEHLTGLPDDESTRGCFFWDVFLAPEDAGEARAALTNPGPEHESSFRGPHGDLRTVAWSLTQLVDAQGDPILLLTGTDVTERQRQERALRIGEERRRALLEAIPDNMFRIRRDGTYIDFHANAPQTLLTPPDAILGTRLQDQDRIPAELAEAVLAAIDVALGTGRLQTLEYQVADTDREARIVPSGDDEVFMIVRDVTEQRRQQEELRTSELRHRTLLEAIPDNVFRLRPDGTIVDFHAHDQSILELPPEQVVGSSLWEHGRRENVQRIMDGIGAALETGELQTLEYRHPPYEREVRILPSGEGDVFVIIRDITERKRQEAALRESEERGRVLLEAIPDIMFRIRRDGTIVDSHAHDPSQLSTGLRGTRGLNLREIPQADAGVRIMACVEKALETGTLQTVEYETGTSIREGRVLPSGPDEVVMISRDVSDRKAAEEELRRSRARIVEAADLERRRLERNLHDGAQQRLVALSLALRLAQAQLHRDPPAAESMLVDAQQELAEALADLRELARGIHPAILTDRGLGPALEALAVRAPVEVELVAVPDERLPDPVEAAAYYVVAEGLTNVVKYARASAVRVSVERLNGVARVEVADDGVGGADPTGGTGLRGLADRVEALDGRLAVDSAPGEGTRLRAEIPV